MSDLPPYARTLGVTIERWEDGAPVLACDYRTEMSGNPGTFHGGALGGLLEMAALMALRAATPEAREQLLGLTVEFLRTAGMERTYATARLFKSGRRLANIRAEAWQADRTRPVATAFVNVALTTGKID